jgi:hypothetical protein
LDILAFGLCWGNVFTTHQSVDQALRVSGLGCLGGTGSQISRTISLACLLGGVGHGIQAVSHA